MVGEWLLFCESETNNKGNFNDRTLKTAGLRHPDSSSWVISAPSAKAKTHL